MRLVIFDDDRLGVLRGAEVIDASGVLRERGFQSPGVVLPELIREWEMLAPALESLLRRERGRPLAACTLKAPVARPGKIVCVPAPQRDGAGLGRAHLVAPSALTGPGAHVRLPPRPVEYAVGLALVLDCGVAAHATLSPVFGYSGAIALQTRGWEERSLRASAPGFLALGPCLLTHDQLPALDALVLRAWHNQTPRLGVGRPPLRAAGERSAHGGARRLGAETIAAVLAGLGEWLTWEPGDVLVLAGFWPSRRLAPGDRVRLVVEPLGELAVTAVGDPVAAGGQAHAAGARSAAAARGSGNAASGAMR